MQRIKIKKIKRCTTGFVVLILLFSVAGKAYGQKEFDNVVTLNIEKDTYEKVRIAFVNADFIVKDNGNKDTLTTYSRKLESIPGFMIVRAAISGSTVKIFGVYGLVRINDWGYEVATKKYKPVSYYKGSKTWKLLYAVAKNLSSEMSFSKE